MLLPHSFLSFLLVISSAWLSVATPTPLPYDPSPFILYGQVLDATVDDPTDILSGGTILVDDQRLIVPKNTMVELPSIFVPWTEIFRETNGTWVPDLPNWASGGSGGLGWEVSVIGNRVNGQNIVGIIYLFQELLETQGGFVTSINYTTGTLFIGGDGGSPDSGAIKAILSDPEGVFGLPHGDYPLWTTDTENPSVRASTGYPVCVPRVDPAVDDDPLCPRKNRPVDSTGQPLRQFTFPPASNDTTQPDPHFFAPIVVGDYVDISGVWVPDPSAPNGRLLVAYTLVDNLGFYTTPGTYPAYLTIEVAQWGIVGDPAGEVGNTRIEGYTTDETAQVEVFAVDVDPCTGVRTRRTLGVIAPRLTGRRGQWRWRPTVDIPPDYTREVGAKMADIPSSGSIITPNGVEAGVFETPIMDEGFLFPELILFGANVPVNEFNLLRFLAQGYGPYLGNVPGRAAPATAPIVGQLEPWPGASAPQKAVCGPTTPGVPIANAGPDVSVRPGTTVTFTGSSDSVDIPESDVSFSWAQTAGPNVTLLNPTSKNASFVAPAVTAATMFTFELTASSAGGNGTDDVNVVVSTTAVDMVRVVSVTVDKIRGDETLNVIAETSVTDGSVALEVSATGSRPDIPFTQMTRQQGGRYTFSAPVDRDPTLVNVRSSWGGSATWIPA